MSKLILLAVAPIAVATTPIALAVAAKNYPQPTQVVQSENGKQLLQQGLKLYQTEQFSQAVQVLQQAAVKFQSEGDALNQALALNYVALATQQLGLPQASKAIADSLTLLPKNGNLSKEYLSVRAQALNTQGQIQLAQGQYEQALASWLEASSLYTKIGDQAGEIGSKINQTQAQQALGLYNRARITLNEVNQRLQQQPDPQLRARGLLSLGNALRVVGILDQKDPQVQEVNKLGSLQVLEQSLAVASKLNSPQLVAEINLSLGNTAQALYLRLGESDEGRQNLAKALEYYQQAAADNASPPTRLVAQINQLRLVIESPEARKVSYQALLPQIQSQLETLPPSHKVVYARINYAQSLVCLKQKTEKRRTNTSLPCPIQEKEELDTTTYPTPEWAQIATIVATANEQAKSLGDKRGQAYALGTLGGLYEQTQQWEQAQKLTQQASALAESIQAKDIGYRWQWQLGRILKTRGNQPAAIAAYTKAVDNLKSLRSDLVAVNRYEQLSFREGVEPVYRELVSLLLESKDPSQDNLVNARNVIESLQLAELDNFFRRACIDAKPVQIDEVDRTAAVIYPVILSDRMEVILSVPSNSPNQKQGILRRHTIAQNQKQVEEKIEQLRQTLENRTTPEYLPLSQEVYKWIIEPIAPELANRRIKNLVFVLDGSLRSIPMGALHDGKQFLVNQYNIALTPGLQLLNPRPLARTQLRTVAAGLTEGKEDFDPLPYVKVELDQIKSTVPDTQVLLNNKFTTSAIENAVKSLNAPVVHLATHGQFSSKAEDTFILTNDGKIDVERLNSLLKTRETNQQGAIELLVLSACSTASGDRKAALGIAGVAVRSGARSTLASLWVVDDEATSVIMGEFYQQLKKPNITKAEAFKLAQLSMLKDDRYKHPYFWAPYVLVGNWL